jgi:hypothetical protein
MTKIKMVAEVVLGVGIAHSTLLGLQANGFITDLATAMVAGLVLGAVMTTAVIVVSRGE